LRDVRSAEIDLMPVGDCWLLLITPPLAEPWPALELGLVGTGAAVLVEEDFVLPHPSASAQPALSARATPAVRSSVLLILTLFSDPVEPVSY
jgi:hypothetical protein